MKPAKIVRDGQRCIETSVRVGFHSRQRCLFRREPVFAEGVRRIRTAGGIASLAHPVRVKSDLPAILPALCEAGLNAIEAYHSDHSSAETGLYLELARKYGLLVTGGSDFHGDAKPGVRLGSGCEGNLKIPDGLVRRLRAAVNVQART